MQFKACTDRVVVKVLLRDVVLNFTAWWKIALI